MTFATPCLSESILRFENLTTDDNLPDNTVRSVLQDRAGFLWFGTGDGLVRYDGYSMRTFYLSTEDSLNVETNSVQNLLEDKVGNIWMTVLGGGLVRYDPQGESFNFFRQSATDTITFTRQTIADLSLDNNGNIWITSLNEGVFCLNPPTGALTRFSTGTFESLILPDDRLTTIFADDSGFIWLGYLRQGVVRFNPKTETAKYFKHQTEHATSLPDNRVRDIYQAPNGEIWVSTYSGLALWETSSENFRTFKPQPGTHDQSVNHLEKITSDDNGLLWIGSTVGLYSFDPVSEIFNQFPHDPQNPDSPVHSVVLSPLCDRSGIIWAGTWQRGVIKFNPQAQVFQVEAHHPQDPQSLDNNSVLSIFNDSQETLWVGTGTFSRRGSRGGLNKRQSTQNKFQRIPFPDDRVRAVRAIIEKKDGSLLLGTDFGLWAIKPGMPKAFRPLKESLGINEISIISLALDHRQNLWIGTAQTGIFRYNFSSNSVSNFISQPGDSTSIGDNAILSVLVDHKQRLWIGTDGGGLNLFLPESETFQRFLEEDFYLASINSITTPQPADDNLLLSTYGGLVQFNTDGKVLDIFNPNPGKTSYLTGAVLVDGSERQWISTDRGLVRYSPDTKTRRIFTTRDGLPGNRVCFTSCDIDGVFFFGGQNGLFSFDPSKVFDRSFVPPVVITDIQISNARTKVQPDSPLPVSSVILKQLTLHHRQNDISLTFAALDFARPEANRYRYHLENYDNDWREAGIERTAVYSNLSPGKYRFRLQGSNSEGIWNPKETILEVTVLPPWWATKWAFVAYLVLVVFIILGSYKLVVNRERVHRKMEIWQLEARQLNELDQMRTRFFTNISHEFKTPLTLIKGPLHLLQADPHSGTAEIFAMMARNTKRLQQLIEQLLDMSRLEAGKLPVKRQRGALIPFIRGLSSNYDGAAREKGIAFVKEFQDESGDSWFDPDLVEKIVTNLLSNAFKFTPPSGQIKIAISLCEKPADEPGIFEEDHAAQRPLDLKIIISNSGTYIPPSEQQRVFDRFYQIPTDLETDHQGSGIGLALVKELVTLLDGTIEIESFPAKETQFLTTIPVKVDLRPPVIADDSSDDTVDSEVAQQPMLLLVEDNSDVRLFLHTQLSANYQIVETDNGLDGLDQALAKIPDLILSDVKMPGMDGIELCRQIKADRRTSHIPIILLTARSDIESRHAGLKVGADEYLPKPFDPIELKIRVENLIQTRVRLREVYSRSLDGSDSSDLPEDGSDNLFLSEIRSAVRENLADPDFNVDALARELGVNRVTLNRKLTALTGRSPSELIRTSRLNHAAALLKNKYGNVTEVAYASGFNNLSHFTRNFRSQFGVTPSKYVG